MDDTDLYLAMAGIENSLILKFRPTFLALQEPQDDSTINVVMSSNVFNTMSINDRVSEVLNCINNAVPGISDKYLVVVQTYNGDEMTSILEDTFENR